MKLVLLRNKWLNVLSKLITEAAGSVSHAQYLSLNSECEAWALALARHRPQCMVVVNEQLAHGVTADKAKTPKVLF